MKGYEMSNPDKAQEIADNNRINDEKMTDKAMTNEVANIVYDTLMGNTQHRQLDLTLVDNQYIDTGLSTPEIRFTHNGDTEVIITIETTQIS